MLLAIQPQRNCVDKLLERQQTDTTIMHHSADTLTNSSLVGIVGHHECFSHATRTYAAARTKLIGKRVPLLGTVDARSELIFPGHATFIPAADVVVIKAYTTEAVSIRLGGHW